MKNTSKNIKKRKIDSISDEDIGCKNISFDDEIARVFDDVLDKNEKIIKGLKPAKSVFMFSKILMFGVPCLLLTVLGLIAFFLPDAETPYSISLAIMIVALVLSATIFVSAIYFSAAYYKRVFYVLSNKRVIIRSAIFGVNFQTLDFNNIRQIDVKINVIDKIFKHNTGTIRFLSEDQKGRLYIKHQFLHISNPQELCNEMQEYIKITV